MPVKFGSWPARALAYRPLTSRARLGQRRVDEDLDELAGSNSARAGRRSARNGEMKLTSTIRPASTISLATSATRRMFSTRSGVGEAEVAVEAVAHVVAVEQVGVQAQRQQRALDQVGDGRLAGARQAGEPQAARRWPFGAARAAVDVERLPVHVGGAAQGDGSSMPAPTVALV
jgi:hypothetical protein